MNKVLIVLIVSLPAILFINFIFTGHAFALNFGDTISGQSSMLLIGIFLIGVAGCGIKINLKNYKNKGSYEQPPPSISEV